MGLFSLKREIGPDTVLQRKGSLLFNQIDGETVMLSIENGEYYGMDKIGSRIWEILEHKTKLKDLVFKLINEYEVPEERCTRDTLDFLRKLQDKKLIILSI